MTDDMMALRGLMEKSADADLLREMISFAALRLMELEVQAKTGAAFEKNAALINHQTSRCRPSTDAIRHGVLVGRPHPESRLVIRMSQGFDAGDRRGLSRAHFTRRGCGAIEARLSKSAS
jgi:hypothetical protein